MAATPSLRLPNPPDPGGDPGGRRADGGLVDGGLVDGGLADGADAPAVAVTTSGQESRKVPPLELDGPSGVLRVWLGGSDDPAALEADVRTVSDSGVPRPAVAVALGDVARRHKLEVRVVPRVDDKGGFLLVIFGKRVAGSRR